MNDIMCSSAIPPSTPSAIKLVTEIAELANNRVQVPIETKHTLHGGIYTRTICIPAGVMVTGVLIKVPTTMVISGKCRALVGDSDEIMVEGYAVIPASAGRKQIVIADEDTYVSAYFSTNAKNIKQAEEEFTDETLDLKSRDNKNHITVTGE